MIVLIAQMWPKGDASSAYEIGRAYVANVGGTATRGDYQVAVCRRGSDAVPAPINPTGPKATRSGEIRSYPRLAYNQWRLQIRALLACFPEEKHIAATGKSLICDEQALLIEPTDEQALELGAEICGGNWPRENLTGAAADEFAASIDEEQRKIGREAWRRGARPRGF